MAAGDAQRAWFPEMLAILRKRWHPEISWEEVSQICDDMQELRDEIRKERNIKPIRMHCYECGTYSLAEPLRISIRSLLYALIKAKVVTEAEFKVLDRNWKKYRKENNLDLYGKEVEISEIGHKSNSEEHNH